MTGDKQGGGHIGWEINFRYCQKCIFRSNKVCLICTCLQICAIYQELLCAVKQAKRRRLQWITRQSPSGLHLAAKTVETGEIIFFKQTMTNVICCLNRDNFQHDRCCLFSFTYSIFFSPVSPPGICISLGRRGPPSEFSIPKAQSHCDGAPRFIIKLFTNSSYL